LKPNVNYKALYPGSEYGSIYHTGVHHIICTLCGIVVLPKFFITHLKNAKHSLKPAELDRIIPRLDTFVVTKAIPVAHGPVVQGLHAPVAALKCSECDTTYRTTSGINDHWNKTHKVIGPFRERVNAIACHAQTFFLEKKILDYFPVNPALTFPMTPAQLLLAKYNEANKALFHQLDTAPAVPSDAQNRDPTMAATDWDRFITDEKLQNPKFVSTIHDLTHPADDDPLAHQLQESVKLMFVDAAQCASRVEREIRVLLLSGDHSASADSEWRIF
jgi:hypothetical protein